MPPDPPRLPRLNFGSGYGPQKFILHAFESDYKVKLYLVKAKTHSSVGRVPDFRTEGCWFHPQLGQYSFWGLMIVIATGFIQLSVLCIVFTMVIWESSQWLGKNIVQSTGKLHGKLPWYNWNTIENSIKYYTINQCIL